MNLTTFGIAAFVFFLLAWSMATGVLCFHALKAWFKNRKKHQLTLTITPQLGKSAIVHQRRYFFEWLAVVAAWWHGRHFYRLVQQNMFSIHTSIIRE